MQTVSVEGHLRPDGELLRGAVLGKFKSASVVLAFPSPCSERWASLQFINASDGALSYDGSAEKPCPACTMANPNYLWNSVFYPP